MSQTRDSVDAAIRQAFDAGLHERAATLTIEEYGPELFGFVLSQLRDRDAASEVFSEFSEAFWKALPGFEWRCSIRTFTYKLLRRSAGHYRERARRAHVLPHPQLSQLSVAVERVRTATLAYQRTDVKDRFQELRAQLSEEDQALLVLRVDRGLHWRELAEVMLGEERPPDAEHLAAEAARLRKRFQIAKDRLRALVAEAGLLDQE